jgi:hypothetical protein
VYVPLATLRHKPARIISRWLVASASAGVSFTVGTNSWLYLILHSLWFVDRGSTFLATEKTPLTGQVYSSKDAALQGYSPTRRDREATSRKFRLIFLQLHQVVCKLAANWFHLSGNQGD